MVSLADLATLGVRELSYRYELGVCWDHEFTVKKPCCPARSPTLKALCPIGRPHDRRQRRRLVSGILGPTRPIWLENQAWFMASGRPPWSVSSAHSWRS